MYCKNTCVLELALCLKSIVIDGVHILIDVERNKKLCKNATLKLLHNEFPAVQLISKEAHRFCREHSLQQIPGTLHMHKTKIAIQLHVVRNHLINARRTHAGRRSLRSRTRLPCSELEMHRNPDPVSWALKSASYGTDRSSSLHSGTPPCSC